QEPPPVPSRVDLQQEVPNSIIDLPAREAILLLVPVSPDREPVTTAVSCVKRAATTRPEQTAARAREGDSVRISGPVQAAQSGPSRLEVDVEEPLPLRASIPRDVEGLRLVARAGLPGADEPATARRDERRGSTPRVTPPPLPTRRPDPPPASAAVRGLHQGPGVRLSAAHGEA